MKHSNNSPPAPERAELERQFEALQRDIRQLQLLLRPYEVIIFFPSFPE